MKAEPCNGWTNYATWNVVLWIDNVEGSYTRKNQWIREFSGRIMPHDIRRAATTYLHLSGMPVKRLQSILGRNTLEVAQLYI